MLIMFRWCFPPPLTSWTINDYSIIHIILGIANRTSYSNPKLQKFKITKEYFLLLNHSFSTFFYKN